MLGQENPVLALPCISKLNRPEMAAREQYNS